MVMVADDVMDALDMAPGERQERLSRPDGILQRGEHKLQQIAVDHELVRPRELGFDAINTASALSRSSPDDACRAGLKDGSIGKVAFRIGRLSWCLASGAP